MFCRRPFDASKQHVPCLAHVINLAVQAMLGKGGLEAEAPSDAESMDVEDDDDFEWFTRTSIVEDEYEEGTATASTETVIAAAAAVEKVDNTSTKRALQKLRKVIVKIRRSPPRLEKFKELTITADRKQGLSPLLDVCTRWGSTHVMIERALECKDAYCSVFLDDDLSDFILEEVEWRRLGSLRELLQHFDKLTTKVCARKTY
ncbi:hypothetical protein BG000_005764, partial [Podila horticola]